MQKKNNFILLVTGYNSGAKLLEKCINSIAFQSYHNYKVIYIDDASTDNESRQYVDFIKKFDKCTLAIQREHNKGILFNKTMPLLDHQPDDDDIIVILDSDDMFYCDFVLEYLNNVYQEKDIWFTYGTLVGNKSGIMRNFCQPIPEDIPIRKLPWITSQLKTVKWFVYKNVLHDDLLDMNGDYYKACSDLSMFWPIIEMIGPKHTKFIPYRTYVYHEATGKNVHMTNREYQLACDNYLRLKPAYKLKAEHLLRNHVCDWRKERK